MIKYDNDEKSSDKTIIDYKEYLKRKKSIIEFRKEVKKQARINSKRRQMSIEYSKKYISD